MRRIAVLSLCVLTFFGFVWLYSKQKKIEKIESKPVVVQEENVEKVLENVYQNSFNRGYRAFISQFAKKEEPGVVHQYTVQTQEQVVSEKIKETPEYKEAVDKGYVDGYHRASKMNQCPRSYWGDYGK